MKAKDSILISGACLVKESRGFRRWFVVRQKGEEKWEFPKVVVRRGESSVRAVLRLLGEKGGMATRVLEEVGRSEGTTSVNGKSISQRFIYYLMYLRNSSGEPIGFQDFAWFDYPKALRSLSSKREKLILKLAKEEFKKWEKTHKRKR